MFVIRKAFICSSSLLIIATRPDARKWPEQRADVIVEAPRRARNLSLGGG